MSTSMSIKAADCINGSVSSRSALMKRQVAQLKMQKKQIEDNKALSDKEKEQRLKRIEMKIDSLDQQISSAERKAEKEKKADEYKEEIENIKSTVDPETAELMMKLKELTKAAAGKDISVKEPDALRVLSGEILIENSLTDKSKEYSKSNINNLADNEPETIEEIMGKLRKRIDRSGYIVDKKL